MDAGLERRGRGRSRADLRARHRRLHRRRVAGREGSSGRTPRSLERFRAPSSSGCATSRRLTSSPAPTYGPKGHTVLPADFVTDEDGTGLVHTAIAFGEDDFRLGEEQGLSPINPVPPGRHLRRADHRLRGPLGQGRRRRSDRGSARRGRLLRSRALRALISALLALRHAAALLRQAVVVHRHQPDQGPAAGRQRRRQLAADARQARPLRQVARGQRRLGAVARALLGHAAAGVAVRRRTRPRDRVAGRAAGAFSGVALEDPHRPFVDDVTFECSDCGEPMQRVPEVIDVWFDSGSMPFAQFHSPQAGTEEFEAHFPADYICEALDQTRGWFYSMLAVSTLLFDTSLVPQRHLPGPDPRRAGSQDEQVARATCLALGRDRTPTAPTRSVGTSSPPSTRGTATASRSRRSARRFASSCCSCGTPTGSTSCTRTRTGSTAASLVIG